MSMRLTFSLLALATGLAAAQPAKPAPPAPAPKPVQPPPPARNDVGAPPPVSAPACFELSKDGKAWSKTPEQLCVGSGDKAVEIKLQSGMPTPQTIATFTLDLRGRARCIDCNQDVFALSNPENSVFNQLSIRFDGKRDAKTPSMETGTVKIGATKFFYRKR